MGSTRVRLVRGDITEQRVDAVVNAANRSLMGSSGVDGAIHRRDGAAILGECRRLRDGLYPAGLPTGQAVATTAGRLPARLVIHTVGPIWRGGHNNEAPLLADCYRNVLQVSRDNDVRTLAYRSISTGAFGFPIERAARIALETVMGASREGNGGFQEIRFILFSEKDLAVYSNALREPGTGRDA